MLPNQDAQGVLKEGPLEKFDVMKRDRLIETHPPARVTQIFITWLPCFLPKVKRVHAAAWNLEHGKSSVCTRSGSGFKTSESIRA